MLKKKYLSVLFVLPLFFLGTTSYAAGVTKQGLPAGKISLAKEVAAKSSHDAHITVWDLAYDASAKTVTGKTEPNANVYISGNGQGIWTADEQGNFSSELPSAKPGDVVKIAADYDHDFDTAVEFTIPSVAVPVSKEKDNTLTSTTSKLEQSSSKKSMLPATGEKSQRSGIILGFAAVTFVFYIFRNKLGADQQK